MSIQDGRLDLVSTRSRPTRMVAMLDVPMTLAGVSRINAQNAMAAAAAALAIGLPAAGRGQGPEDVRPGPRTQPRASQPVRARRRGRDDRLRPQRGRDERPGRDLATGFGRAGGQVWLAICTAGDRTDEILQRSRSGPRWVRTTWRSPSSRSTCAGARARTSSSDCRTARRTAGVHEVDRLPRRTRPRCGRWWARLAPGDVVGVTALGMRPEIFAWLEDAGATRMGPADVRRVVRRAQASRA